MAARTLRGERARLEILETAQSVLLEGGIDSFSLRQVAARAGYTPSALYNHFGDKDALIVALAMRAVTALAACLGDVPPGPAPDRLRELCRAYGRFAEAHPQEYRVVFDSLVNPPHTWDAYVAVAHPFSLIVETCQQGLDEGSLVDKSGLGASAMAYGLWCLADGNAHLRAKHLAAIEGPFDAMYDASIGALLANATRKG